MCSLLLMVICGHGMQVKPQKGSAILFWTFKPDGNHDVQSLHGACPVIRGEKWVMTRWIHGKPVR